MSERKHEDKPDTDLRFGFKRPQFTENKDLFQMHTKQVSQTVKGITVILWYLQSLQCHRYRNIIVGQSLAGSGHKNTAAVYRVSAGH